MEQNNLIDKVKSIILKAFYFLEEEYYYVPSSKIIEDDTFIESFEVEYINKVHRRKIQIGYTKNKIFEDIKYTFHISISRIPYSNSEDFFSFSKYLQSKGVDFSTSMVNHFDENEAKEIVNKIAQSLRENALEIIEGKIWYETFYPRRD